MGESDVSDHIGESQLEEQRALIKKIEGYNRQHQHDLMVKDALIEELKSQIADMSEPPIRLRNQIEYWKNEFQLLQARAIKAGLPV
jgi:hypothetical protein